jgi:hypothetical protein
MYEAPRLEKFGRFRDLTLQYQSKTVAGNDLALPNGHDCDPLAPSTDPLACRS